MISPYFIHKWPSASVSPNYPALPFPFNQIDSPMPGKQSAPSSMKSFTFTLRRSRVLFVIIMLIAVLAVVWPGHALFSDPEPFIFGFPLSFAWVILWVFVSFIAMTGLYLSDKKHEGEDF